jgi:hypothetical protein
MDGESGAAEALDDGEAFGDGSAVGLVEAADGVVVGGDGEADAEAGAAVEFGEEGEVAEDEGSAGLDGADGGRAAEEGFEDPGHEGLLLFGGLVGIDEGGAVDEHVWFEGAGEELGGVFLEGGELAPMLPVLGFEAAVDAHGRDVAVGAGEGAVAGRGEGVGEAGLGDEAGGAGEDGAGRLGKDAEAAGHFLIMCRCAMAGLPIRPVSFAPELPFPSLTVIKSCPISRSEIHGGSIHHANHTNFLH